MRCRFPSFEWQLAGERVPELKGGVDRRWPQAGLRGNAAGDEGGDCYFLQCSEGKFAFVDSCFFWECFESGPKAIRELGKRKVGELVSMVAKEVESFAECLGCVAKEFRLLPKMLDARVIRRRVRDVPCEHLDGRVLSSGMGWCS